MYPRSPSGSFWRGFVGGLCLGLILVTMAARDMAPAPSPTIQYGGLALLNLAIAIGFGAVNWVIHRVVGPGGAK